MTDHTTVTSGRMMLTIQELFMVFSSLGIAEIPLVELEFAQIEAILASLSPEVVQSAGSMGMTIKVPIAVSVLAGLPTPVKQQVLVPFLMAVRSGNVSSLTANLPSLPTPVVPAADSTNRPTVSDAPTVPGKVLMFQAKMPPNQTLTPRL